MAHALMKIEMQQSLEDLNQCVLQKQRRNFSKIQTLKLNFMVRLQTGHINLKEQEIVTVSCVSWGSST